MHLITILRYYLGLTQTELSERSGVSFADVNEMENRPPYGMIDKYRKLAAYLHVPVHAIAMNDILSVPASFFDHLPPAEYRSPANCKNGALGRQGEDTVFHQEQERLAAINPTMAKLVIPCYKLRAARGYDIISYKEDGTPVFIEVKTSEKDSGGIQLTRFEYETANKLTGQGYDYWICYFSGWGTGDMHLEKVLYRSLLEENRIEPARYSCDFRERPATENGILHFRRKMGLSQIDAANLLEIPVSSMCKYESGENQCPVVAYQKMSRLFGVEIDVLLQDYPA